MTERMLTTHEEQFMRLVLFDRPAEQWADELCEFALDAAIMMLERDVNDGSCPTQADVDQLNSLRSLVFHFRQLAAASKKLQ